jgi:hypothetical protein
MDTSMEVSPSGADASVEVAAAAEEAAGSKPEAARQPHAMLASRTYLEKATVEYTVHKLPGMLTRTLAQWGKTSISAALQTRGVAEADIPGQIKAIAAQTLGGPRHSRARAPHSLSLTSCFRPQRYRRGSLRSSI